MITTRFSFAVAAIAVSCFAMPTQAETILLYNFPASWDGTGTDVTDLSAAGNNGMTTGSVGLSATIPSDAPAGDQSLAPDAGGILTTNINLLENPTIATAGGFAFEASIYWDGGEGNRTAQKIIDNEGTESLQIQDLDLVNGTAELQFRLNDIEGPTTRILANQWYHVLGVFNTGGNAIDVDGSLAGTASLIVDGVAVSQAVTRMSGPLDPGMGTSSDTLDRPIAVGVLALPGAPTLVDFSGFIYNPTVRLIPEPSTTVLMLVTALAGLVAHRHSS